MSKLWKLNTRQLSRLVMLGLMAPGIVGCSSLGGGQGQCTSNECGAVTQCGGHAMRGCHTDDCNSWKSRWHGHWAGKCRSKSIPEILPLGSTIRSHYQVMQTNAEAADFILYDHDFVGQTAELTPLGRDKVMEIAARMRSAPFPVLIERSENNSDPELDAYRRTIVAQVLTDHGNPDADQRTIVALPYGPGYQTIEAQQNYFQHIGGGIGNGNFNNVGAGFNGGGVGGFGGGFGGGVGGF